MRIDVGREFSKTPFGRYPSDGENNATKFRENFLRNAFSGQDAEVVIDFSSVNLGVGSSFLEEAFGGLVREGVTPKVILSKLKVEGGLSTYRSQIERFVFKAEALKEA